MPVLPIEQAMENIYTSLKNNNQDIDVHISALKESMTSAGLASATVDPARLAQNNRQGRKIMQSYFKRRGVTVEFKE